MEAKALWHFSPTSSGIENQVIPLDKSTRVTIKSLYSLLSNGTESLVAKGLVPLSLFDEMSVPYQEGDFSFPIKYGYSLVGQIVSAEHARAGQLVHLLHPHQDLCMVNEGDYSFVPNGVTPQRAALASNLETAVNAVWDSKLSLGDQVLICGFGLIGSLVARLVSMFPGVDLSILEIDVERRTIAKEMDFQLAEEARKEQYDIAFHTSGTSAGLQSCIEAIGFGASVVELSWYGTKEVVINLGGSFHSQRKQLISSQVSHLPPERLSRWDYARRKEIVFKLLQNPVFDAHISEVIPFSAAPDFFDRLRKGSIKGLATLISYPK